MIGLVTCLWHNSPWWEKMPEVPEEGFYPGQCCFSSSSIGHVWMWHLELLHLSWNHIGSQTKIKSIRSMTAKKDLKKLSSSIILLVSLLSKSGTQALDKWEHKYIFLVFLFYFYIYINLTLYNLEFPACCEYQDNRECSEKCLVQCLPCDGFLGSLHPFSCVPHCTSGVPRTDHIFTEPDKRTLKSVFE